MWNWFWTWYYRFAYVVRVKPKGSQEFVLPWKPISLSFRPGGGKGPVYIDVQPFWKS